VDVPGRGRTTVWETPGPLGAPTLVLLHGVTLDAEVNWSGVVPTLARRFHVLTLDLSGHGDGLPARVPYRLEDCADDVAAVVRALGVGPVIPVGYSMGGMVAQAFWRRHRELTAGLVLCATARNFSGSLHERMTAMVMPFVVNAVGWIPPLVPMGADLLGVRLLGEGLAPHERRRAIIHMRRTSLVTALSAMQAVCDFTSHRWIGGVDVPAAVVVTRHDRVVPPSRQWRLARALPGATVVEIDGDHGVFLDAPGTFAAALVRACLAATPSGDDTGNDAERAS
jgi:pimeloyl-ACP methyl ester carboxylesterase